MPRCWEGTTRAFCSDASAMQRRVPTDRVVVKAIWPLSVVVAVVLAVVDSCGGGDGFLSLEKPGPPVGTPAMPDIAPGPPQDARMSRENGRWLIRFSTLLANVGDG